MTVYLPEMLVKVLFILASDTGVGRPQFDRIVLDFEVNIAQAQDGAEAYADE